MPLFEEIITIHYINTSTFVNPINKNNLINLFNNKSILKHMGGL